MLLEALLLWIAINGVIAEKCYKCTEVVNIKSRDHVSGNCDLSLEAARLKGVRVDVVRCDSDFCGVYSSIQNGK